LNCEKAANQLHWLPAYSGETAVAKTVDWFKEHRARRSDAKSDMYFVCAAHIQDYTKEAVGKGMTWCE
jgi:dTDP-D-glucose 4,6-dehydratase